MPLEDDVWTPNVAESELHGIRIGNFVYANNSGFKCVCFKGNYPETFCTVRECEVVDSRVNLEMSAHVKLTCCSPGTHVEEAIQWVLGSIQDSQSSSAKSKDYSLPFYKVRLLSSIRSFQLSRNIVIKHTCPYTSSVYYFYDIWKLLKHNNAKLSYMIGHALDGGQFLARCGLRTTCQLLLRLSKQWPL